MSAASSFHFWRVAQRSAVAALVVGGCLIYGCTGSGASRTEASGGGTVTGDSTQPDTLQQDTLQADTLRRDTLPRTADTLTQDGRAGGEAVAGDSIRADSLAPDGRPLAGADTTEADRDRSDDPAEEDRPAFVDADSLDRFVQDGERLQDLSGDVFVRQDSTRLRSRFARRFLDRGEFLFTQDVVIFERGDTLYADTVRYDKNRKIGRARGNVRLTDGDVVVRAPRAIYYTQEKRSVFPDSVTLVDSTRTLRASTGTYFSPEDRAEFGGNVQMTDSDTYMEADSVTYLRKDEVSIARGNVFIERDPRRRRSAGADTTRRTFLFGDLARNEERNRRSSVWGNALLIQIRTDSAGRASDTLVVASREMEVTRRDSLRRLVAIDSVRIWQPDLAALADSAVYDRLAPDGDRPPERLYPPRPADPLRVRAVFPPLPDLEVVIAELTRVRIAPSGGAVPDPTRFARADTAGTPPDATEPSDTPAREESRLFRDPVAWFEGAQVTGDTIRVVARERSLDTVFVHGNAFVAQEDTATGRIQQLKGRTITARFHRDTLRVIVAEPNARAIRFLSGEGGEGNGAAKPSGDRIAIRFRNGSVDRVSVIGGVQNQYYQEGKVPEPFQLEGYSWTPDRKPRLEDLVDRPQVGQRLGDFGPRPTKPTDPTVPDSVLADSMRTDSLRVDAGRSDSIRAARDVRSPRRASADEAAPPGSDDAASDRSGSDASERLPASPAGEADRRPREPEQARPDTTGRTEEAGTEPAPTGTETGEPENDDRMRPPSRR